MKAVVISVILLIAVVTGTVLNFFFVNSRIDEMKQITQRISESNGDRLSDAEELYALWERNREALSISTGLREIDRATENLLCLVVACQSDNEWAIQQSCTLFCNALDDIARYEKFSIESIL